MSDSADNLTAKQHKAIAALIRAHTIADAATALGVNERQVYRWLDDPAFVTAYRAALAAALEQAKTYLLQSSGKAAETLVRLLTCGKPAIELGAANSILEKAARFKEIEEFAARLAALEAAYAAKL